MRSGSSNPPEYPTLVLDECFLVDRGRLDDAPANRRFALDPDAARFFGWTIEDARAQPDAHYEEGIHRFAREWTDGARFALTIRRRSDGEPVGAVELRPRSGTTGEADVSYMVAAELRGQGIAPMALEALLVWSASELGITRAHLGCHIENAASRRVAEKCHFDFIGRVGDELRFQRELDTTAIEDEKARRWAAEALNVSSVREVDSLTFGITSDVRLLEVDGEPVVLRRYTEGPVEEGFRLIEAEVVALTEAMTVFGGLAPEPLASDASGVRAGNPALLMSFLPGSAVIHNLDVRRSADALTNLHRSTVPVNLPPAHEWLDYKQLAPPSWAESPGAWRTLAELLRDPAPTAPAVFLHSDYHPGNLLWQKGELSGIVDWAFASHGPAAIDVAHMRTNLALIDGPEQAEAFLQAYSELNPTYVHDQWWDARDLFPFGDDFAGVLAFNAFGACFTVPQLRSRADAYAAALAGSRGPKA